MPPKPGPWQLDKVKRRLREEQIAREQAASARYRLQEADRIVEQNINQGSGKNLPLVLLVCVLVFLLLVCVVALCAVVVFLLAKDNERKND